MSKKLLDQALAVYKLGGQEAVEAWFEGLTDDDRTQFIADLNETWNFFLDWMEAWHARLANFFLAYKQVDEDVTGVEVDNGDS